VPLFTANSSLYTTPMSWASRRRTFYILGIVLFFMVTVGIPAAIFLYKPPTCFDGKLNQEETDVDKGGPCLLLDERTLVPHAVVWSRSFEVRDGTYSAVAYIENPNGEAGVQRVGYRFGLYDERNVLVAERDGVTFVSPGGVTPVFQGAIDTGRRIVARTYFEFTEPLIWERMQSKAGILTIYNKDIADTGNTPRLTALVKNESVADVVDPSFVAVAFDTAGNAFAASETLLPRIPAGDVRELVFTWPDAFSYAVGRLDVLPYLPPALVLGN